MGIWEYLKAWIHRKEAEKFTTDTAGKTAVRVVGELDLDITVGTPSIQNVSALVAGTEYSITIPQIAKKYELKARGIAKIQYAFTTGQTNTTYITVSPGAIGGESGLNLSSDLIVYFETNKNNETIEVKVWS